MASLEEALEHVSMQLAALRGEAENDDRTPSRFVGQAADPSYVRQLANDRRETLRTVSEHGTTGEVGAAFLTDLRAWGRGDSDAFQRLAREAKSITGGELLVPVELLGGYLPAVRAAAPMRFLGSRHEVSGREIHTIRELDSVVAAWTAEGMTKPLSDAALDEVVSLIFKAAALVAIPDELNADSGHVAQEVVARGMGTAIGQKIDVALLDGTGIGQPLGVLRNPDVAHTGVTDSDPGPLFDAIVAAIGRVRSRFREPTAVVMRPELLARFAIARTTGSGEFLLPNGLEQHLGVSVVVDGNVPVAAGPPATAPILIGEWPRALHTFSNGGLVLEASQHAGWESDETYVRGYERIGAAVLDPDAVEILDDVEV
jgi:HK97 family phage major capsid protein